MTKKNHKKKQNNNNNNKKTKQTNKLAQPTTPCTFSN